MSFMSCGTASSSVRLAKRVEAVFFGSMGALLILFVLVFVGPQFEGRLAPVAGKMEIILAEQISPNRTRIWAHFHKWRDCEPKGLHFYVGERGGDVYRVLTDVRSAETHMEPFAQLPPGGHSSGPWIIGMSEADLMSYSFADVLHRCHFMWNTRSRFYTSPSLRSSSPP